ncbi:MAG: AraC family transcriptional regulator, partial [Oscillospiraceae bacterium]
MKNSKSFLHKILSLILALTIITTLINLFLLFIIRQRIVTLKIEEQEHFINFYSTQTDDSLQNFINTTDYIENFLSVHQQLLTKDPVYSLSAQQEIFNLLSTFTATFNQIQEAFVYSDNSEFLYTNTGLTNPKTFHSNRFKDGYDSWQKAISAKYPAPTLVAFDSNTATTVPTSTTNIQFFPQSQYYVVKTIFSANGKNTNIILTTTDTFSGTVNPIAKESNEIHLFILDDNSNIIAGDKQYIESLNMIDDISNVSSSVYHSGKGMVSSRESILNGIYYVIFTPNDVLFGGLNSIFLTSSIVSVLVMVIMIITAVRLSSRLYTPFKTIIDVINDMNNDRIEQKNSVEYIQNRVIEVVSVNHNLRENTTNPTQLLMEVILFKLIMGKTNSNKLFIEDISASVGFEDGFYNTILIRMDLRSTSDELFFTEYKEVFDAIILAQDNDIILKIIETRQNEYVVVNYFKDHTQYDLLKNKYNLILKELTDAIPNSYFCISCSKTVNSITQINECYMECIELIKFRNISIQETFIFKDDILLQDEFYLPPEFETEIQNMIESQQREVAIKYVTYILERNYKSNISMHTYLNLCSTINGFLVRFYKHKTKDDISLILINHGDYMYSVERLNEIIITNLELALVLGEEKEHSTIPVISRVEKYVEEHFMEYINLATVAQNLGYTPNYLSKFFKQEKGINFTDYINRKRVDYAKELLANSKLSVKQIATNSGFNS